jgi:uroporphyrinogen-III decarboxylase
MLPRERIERVLEGKPTDIMPYVDGFSNMEARRAYFGPQVMRGTWEEIALLEADLFQSDWIIIPAPLNIPGGPGIFCDTISQDATHILARTYFGGVWYWRKENYYAMAIHNPVKTREDLERLPEPDWESLRKRVKTLRDPVSRLKDRGYWVTMEGKGAFESAWMLLRGLEQIWYDIADDPPFVRQMSERALDSIITLGTMVAEECDVDAIWITDDMGTQQAPYFSLDTFRTVFKEPSRHMVDAFHQAGLKVTYHSHGNVMPLFGDLVDIGFDSIDPLDRYDGMDLRVLKERFGGETILKGGITCTIAGMTPEELKEHVGSVAAIGGNERFILSGAGGVPPEMSLRDFNHYRKVVYEARREPGVI